MIIKYNQQTYQAKIDVLEGYYQILGTHLTRMESLKSEMFNYWNDESAQKAGQALNVTINDVRRKMDQTTDAMAFFRSLISQLEGSKTGVDDLLDAALKVVTGGLK